MKWIAKMLENQNNDRQAMQGLQAVVERVSQLKGMGIAALSAIFLSGCAVSLKPLSLEEYRESISADLVMMTAGQQSVSAVLTHEEAIARALKYNLNHRLAIMERELSNKRLDLSRFDMLPRLAANAGWTERSKEYLTQNEGSVVANESIDKRRSTADLSLTWNILDFGVSYYQAQQNADQVLISKERKRKVINQIVQQVSANYWRAAIAEYLLVEISPKIIEARSALEDAREIERQRLSPPVEMLQYQKELINLIRDLELLEKDARMAKAELASLMGLFPGADFSVMIPVDSSLPMPMMNLDLALMEDAALFNAPDLREERYRGRITALETKKAMLRLLPGIKLSTSYQYDSNSYLVNNEWTEIGLRVSWDLLSLARRPSIKAAAEAEEQVAEMRRLALSMATLTQLHVSYQQYQRARYNYEQANALNEIEKRIFFHISNAVDVSAQTPLQRIRASLAFVFANVGQYYAYDEMQSAMANVYVSMGLDLIPVSVLDAELDEMVNAVSVVLGSIRRGEVHIDPSLLAVKQ